MRRYTKEHAIIFHGSDNKPTDDGAKPARHVRDNGDKSCAQPNPLVYLSRAVRHESKQPGRVSPNAADDGRVSCTPGNDPIRAMYGRMPYGEVIALVRGTHDACDSAQPLRYQFLSVHARASRSHRGASPDQDGGPARGTCHERLRHARLVDTRIRRLPVAAPTSGRAAL